MRHYLAMHVSKKYDVMIIDTVGHVPREISRKFWHFLRHGGRSTCEITGRRKCGNGLEVPCVYRFVGKRKLIEKLEDLLPPDITCPILPILSLFLFISRLAFVRAIPFQKVLPAC